ncbi:hypothetical protein [Thiorhodococcus minor]|uniref:Uncharacterized protein n=1 Tax=Thiorhodococcus minor TaxID=57489 RepID=A0A6M0K1S6_9GAMM|nr:hypothetical protein [Thiorhodococcus minor]NEV63708.1 hypothetical protein [Thiorhodococcus minor]
MKASTTALLASTLALMITLPAQAGRHSDGIYDRLDRQQTRIDRGIDSGELTRREARILRTEHRELRDLARSLRERGHSRDNRHQRRETKRLLHKKLDRTDRRIRRLTSNDAVRWSGRHDRRWRGHRDAVARNEARDAPRRYR